jgi:DNA replication protein DnaC
MEPAALKHIADRLKERESTPTSVLRPCEKCRKFGGRIERVWNASDGQERHTAGPFCDCEFGQFEKRKYEIAQAQERELRIEEYEDAAKIPLRYWNAAIADFDGPQATQAKEAFDTISPDEGDGVFLWGDVGCGKTYLAAAILHDWIRHEHTGLFLPVPDLLDHIRASYNQPKSTDWNDPLERARETTILLLDDLGAEKPTDWVREKLYQLLTHRYIHMKPVIAPSNLSPDQLEAHIGDRAVSRLVGMCRVIRMQGADRRLRR